MILLSFIIFLLQWRNSRNPNSRKGSQRSEGWAVTWHETTS